MWATRACIWVTLLYTTVVARFCSQLDRVTIDLGLPEEDRIDTVKTLHKLTRISSPGVTHAKLTRVEWESVYCPAVEFGPFQDCKQVRGDVHMDHRDMNEMIGRHRVSRPGTCAKGVCDGSDESTCLNPTTFYLDTPPFEYALDLSSSWLHHRCSRWVRSVTVEADGIITNLNTNSTAIEVPGVGHCVFNSKERGCIMDNRWVVLVDGSWERKILEAQFPCIEKGDEKVCYDKDTKMQFYMGPSQCNVVGKATYCREDQSTGEMINQDKVKIVTPEVIYELSLQLEYENLETAFDHQIIMNRFRKVDGLLSSLLQYAFNVSSDPLQQYLGFGVTNVTRRGSQIAGFVCQTSYVNDPHFSEPQGHRANISLFKHNKRFGGYEEMKSQIPFIQRADVTGYDHFNSSKIRHGGADIISTVSLGDYLLPKWFKFLPGVVSHVLPVVNSIVIFMYLYKKL